MTSTFDNPKSKTMPATKKSKPKTQTYTKLVLSPGKIPLNNKGTEFEEFDANRLKSIAKEGNRFLKSGAKIPLPFAHTDEKGQLVSPVNLSTGGAVIDAATGEPIGWRSDLNAGYITKFSYGTVEEDGETYEGLIAEMEVDGDAEDSNTPAGKIGRTVKETSLGLFREYTAKGGEKYYDLPIHVAACLNPRDTKQPNFAPLQTLFSGNVLLFGPDGQDKPNNPAIPDEQTASGDAEVANVVAGLREIGLDLPEDTNLENFFERAVIAIRQRLATEAKGKEEDQNDLTTQPSGNSPPGAPIAMSATTTVSKAEKHATILLSNHLSNKRQTLKDRIDNLVKRQRVTAEYAKKRLYPEVEKITLSNTSLDDLTDDGELPASPVEDLLEGFESAMGDDVTEPGTTNKAPKGEALAPPKDKSGDYFNEEGESDDIDEDEANDLLELSKSIPV